MCSYSLNTLMKLMTVPGALIFSFQDVIMFVLILSVCGLLWLCLPWFAIVSFLSILCCVTTCLGIRTEISIWNKSSMSTLMSSSPMVINGNCPNLINELIKKENKWLVYNYTSGKCGGFFIIYLKPIILFS